MIDTQVKQKILVVDDEPEVTMVVRSRLESVDYEVEVANSGKECLQKIETFKPNLIVLDVMMSDLTGYEICATIKSSPRNWHIPVVMLTSRIKTIDENLGFACKADAYIRKPQSSELLIPEIKKLLKKKLQKGDALEE